MAGANGHGMAGSIACALVSAVLFAVAAALQQDTVRKAATAEPSGVRVLAVGPLARRMLTSRRWLIGQGFSVAGFGCHAVALRLGALPMVQALLVVQLLFALPLAARQRKRRLLRRDWVGAAIVCTGLVLLIAQGVPHGVPRPETLPRAGMVVVTAVVVLFLLSRAARPTQLRASLTAMAAGFCVTSTAVLVSVGTSEPHRYGWILLGVPVTTIIGGILIQEAFAHGSLPTALTTVTIADPVLSYVAGRTLFAAATEPHPLPLAGAAALILGGVALLGNSPTLHDERDSDIHDHRHSTIPGRHDGDIHNAPDGELRGGRAGSAEDGHGGDVRGQRAGGIRDRRDGDTLAIDQVS
ncbi:DMT family transporter [Nocardia sp. CA-120079]|uniref:DMT family transporter n=1 Tax=Nocardia sp. CA-120079 TaxID=3239974 RepID=UPI003D952762